MSTTGTAPRFGVRWIVALIAIALTAAIVPVVVASDASAQDPAAVQAAREIQAARDRADAAAQAMFDAQSKLDTLDVDIAEAEKQLAAVEAQANSMRSSLQTDAQRSFANSGSAMPLLIDLDQANAGITAERQASVARGAASVELDDFDAVMKEVNAQRADLERQQELTVQARENYERLQAEAEAEVVKLAEIEKQRLADVAVQQELERQRRIRAEQEAAAATAAAAQAAANAPRAAAVQTSGGSAAAAPRRPRPARRRARRPLRNRQRRHPRRRRLRRRMPVAASSARLPAHGPSATRGAPPARAAAATRVST